MSKSKPLSLNERNERLLGDFSQSRSSKPASDSIHKEEKPIKVKLQGRRRLCKFSSNPAEDEEESNSLTDSPPKIRDILNDLSSRMEVLSIQKNPLPKTPMSSFSLLSDSDSAPSASSNLSLLPSPGEAINRSEEVKEFEVVHSIHSPSASEDEEDCVILSGKKLHKEVKDGEDGCNPVWDGDSIVLTGPSTYTLPGKFAKMLYPHQREGLNWLWALHCMRKGGILGDDMGLGKTMQVSAFLAGLFHSGLIKRALIVAPKTLLAHWIKELSVVGLSDKIRE